MALDEYKRKRDFQRTTEPPPRQGATATGCSFVVQKHRARQLHYDFRLELDGVLKSWSIPKGPCFDPAVKRLAVEVEDHPVDYGDFEGVIPAGQYGGGTVLLWDRGTWKPLMEPASALADGHLKFELIGEKLRGRWALVRLEQRGRRSAGGKGSTGRNWILVKDRDAHARPESEWNVTVARPESVATGRDLDAIATSSDRIWHSNRTRQAAGDLPGARPGPMPDWMAPIRPKPARSIPDSDEWLHEIEIPGEPLMIRLEGGRVQLCDSRRRDRSRELAALVARARALPARQAILIGVATALGPDGRATADLPADTLYAVDVLYLDGNDLRQVPLGKRKEALATLIAQAGPSGQVVRYADHVVGRGPETLALARTLGAPGIVSKRLDSRYPPAASACRIVGCDARTAAHGDPATRASKPLRPQVTRVAGVKLTHPERILYPEVGIGKLDLARLYERVAERMLPYLADRPLTLVRAPEGVAGHRFFVRHAGDWAPRELRQLDIPEGTGSGQAMTVDDVAGLVALAQMNVIEVHPWNARAADLEHPDRIVFDLDPGPLVPWSDVVDGAKQVRDVLATLELASFVKTTGGKGLHVVVPIEPSATWDDTLAFSRAIAQALARFEPRRFSADLGKADRADKIFVDYLRNRRGATSVSAYSSRAQPMATVSVPITWDDLGFATRNDAFRVDNEHQWYTSVDPWRDYGRSRQRLTADKLKAALTVSLGHKPTPAKRARAGSR
jgi:bifunctional non-homologous end joining protein LigD